MVDGIFSSDGVLFWITTSLTENGIRKLVPAVFFRFLRGNIQIIKIPSKQVSLAMNYKIVSTQLLTLAFCTALHFAIVVRTFSFFKLIDLYILSQKPNPSTKIQSIIDFPSKLLNCFYIIQFLYIKTIELFIGVCFAKETEADIFIIYCSTEAELNKKYCNICYLLQEGSSKVTDREFIFRKTRLKTDHHTKEELKRKCIQGRGRWWGEISVQNFWKFFQECRGKMKFYSIQNMYLHNLLDWNVNEGKLKVKMYRWNPPQLKLEKSEVYKNN